ncbi:peroxidase-like [Ostrinia nubilalis]|uniref:peroxidase-like n=1 Tax=Ostrinia nubilalis TaxID=29057 RepID=UPI0030823D57
MWRFMCVLLLQAALAQVVYDAYFGKPITDSRKNFLENLNATGPCTITVQPCDEHERRRVDGTCVNPKYPSRGGSPTPLLRMLPAKFGVGNNLRPSSDGSDLPSARVLRTKLLSDGYPQDHDFSTLATHIFVFSIVDSVDLTVLLRYAVASDCCAGNTPNRANPQCIPIPVPQDDPYLRRTGVRCMNLTRFATYQEMGCLPDTLPAERYALPTPLEDLSIVYGYTTERETQIRAYEGGLLRSEKKYGVERPPGTAPFCVLNRRPVENACYEFGDSYDGNVLSGIYLTAMWFYREHNRLARKLAELNPCWSDQQLYETARQINIAQWQYMLYYELMGPILGYQNALHAGIIFDTDGFVNDFDEHYKPGVFHEYVIGTRWFHTFQDGRTDLYSKKGDYLGTRTTVDDEFRSGILEVNNTEADLTQGAFRQPAAKFDYVIEPDIAERIFGELQTASDLSAIDIMRGRDQGLPPYNEYRKLCGMPPAHSFEDLHDAIYPDKVEQMRRIYEDVDDVDLMTAIYSEKLIKGGYVGPTLFCIMARNLVQWRKSDRYFFEHGDLPTSLTLPQLNEVRRTSVARLLCDNGDRVDRIQPRALHNAGHGNEIVDCKDIPGIDLRHWTDHKCAAEKKAEIKKELDGEKKPAEVNEWGNYLPYKK